MEFILFKVILFAIQFIGVVKMWNLSQLGIKDYSLLHVSIYKNHAYLSIKVNIGSKNITLPTLVEAPWPPNEKMYLKTKPFPSRDYHKSRKCKHLVQVIQTQVDTSGRIWILDEGDNSINCSGKLLIYNLFTKSVVQNIYLTNGFFQLHSLVLDKTTDPTNQRVLIGVSNANLIYLCTLYEPKCNMIVLKTPSNYIDKKNPVVSEFMAMSVPDELLYITSSRFLGIFSLDLSFLKKIFKQNNVVQLSVEYLGEKLGPSKGLLVDPQGKLCYFLMRDYVIMRWDTSRPLKAESHDVLVQSYRHLPDVNQLLLDPSGCLWAVVHNENVKVSHGNVKVSHGNVKVSHGNVKKSNGLITKSYNPKCIKVVNYDYFY